MPNPISFSQRAVLAAAALAWCAGPALAAEPIKIAVIAEAQAIAGASIPQAALATHSEFVRNHFGIGDDRIFVCGISFGYEDRAHRANSFRTSRASLDDVVRFVAD